MRYLIINGPNLNLLGRREPCIYGNSSFDEVLADVRSRHSDVTIDYYQSNHEGDIIDTLHANGFEGCDGIVINAGAYTHTSVAIADAIRAIRVPVVEVHISNVHTREEFRRHSFLSVACTGIIIGFGTNVYNLGIQALKDLKR